MHAHCTLTERTHAHAHMLCVNIVCMHVQRIDRLACNIFQIVGNVGHVFMHMHSRYALAFAQRNEYHAHACVHTHWHMRKKEIL
jgi:hypothetical protein